MPKQWLICKKSHDVSTSEPRFASLPRQRLYFRPCFPASILFNGINTDRHGHYIIAGELALNGRVRKIKEGLSLALLAKEKGMAGVILPAENAREAAVVEGIDVIPVASLAQAVGFLNEQLDLDPYEIDGEAYQASKLSAGLDFADVREQEAIKQAITIACAGGHNILRIGTN